MKKKFLALLSLLLVAVFALLSGCTGASMLTFENKFCSESELKTGYSETATYTVKNGEYGSLTRNASITEQALTFDISGTFTTKLLIYDAGLVGTRFTQLGIETDISYSDKGRVYYYETNLQLTANYTLNGTAQTPSLDTISTKIFFLEASQSFMPIWSETNGSYSYLVNDSDNSVQANKVELTYTTTYNTSNYNIKQTYKAYKLGEPTQDAPTEKTQTSGYTAKTIIDNNQLLFAIRNIKTVEKDYSAYLPTLSPAYGVAKTLRLKNIENKTETLNNFNGNQLDVPVVNYEFYVNSDKNTGVQKYVSIQTSPASNTQGDSLSAKANVIKYVEPLTILGGSFPCVGALIYTLSSAN